MTQPYHDNMFMNSTGSSFYLSSESSKMTLWMGDLEPWMDEHFLRQLWTTMGENVVVKLIRDKRTGNSLGYAFIGFSSTTAAQRALATIHGTKMPNSQRAFRLNWASGGGILDKKEDRAPEYSLFVGDLSSDVDETYLLAVFRQRYPSCHSAKVMTDPISGASRGYGFVRFHSQQEQQDALIKMNGVYCGHRPVRISLATPKSTSHARYYQLALQAPALIQQPTDPSNTTVFVGGLSTPIHEDELRLYFSPFGEVTYVKIPPGKGCGFVQYVSRASAELAIEKMNGFQIGQSRIRLSWGRSQNDKQPSTSALLHPSTSSSSSSSNNNMNDMNDPAFFLNSSPPPPSISHLPTMSHQQQSIMSLGDTYYMNQQWQQQQQQQQSNHHHHLLLQQQQQQQQQQQASSSPPPLSHPFQHHDSLHHPSISSTMATSSSSSSAPLLIDTKTSPFLRNSTTVYDPNIMLSPVSSTTGNPSTTTTPYSMVINNSNSINASSPGLQSFQSLSPPSSGRFPLRFTQQDDSKIMELENKIYSSTTTTSSTITPIPSSSSTTTTTNHTTLSPPIHFIHHRPEWISPSTSSSIMTNNNNSMDSNMNYPHHHFNNNGNNNNNNNNNNNSDSLSKLNTNSSDHDPSNQHWRRLGGIYA